jgi:hypothetical protein
MVATPEAQGVTTGAGLLLKNNLSFGDDVPLLKFTNRTGDLSLEIICIEARAETENVNAKRANVEVRTDLHPMEDLREEQKQPATRRVKLTVDSEVEAKMTTGRLRKLEEDRIPGDAPGAVRLKIERQAIAEEAEADAPMFAADRVVELIILVSNCRETFQGASEELIVAPASAMLVDHAKSLETEMRRRVNFTLTIRFGERQREQSPEIEFIAR